MSAEQNLGTVRIYKIELFSLLILSIPWDLSDIQAKKYSLEYSMFKVTQVSIRLIHCPQQEL